MLLTITYREKPATDLGFLLHKHPARPQTFELSFGKVYVFYPKAEPEECTAALLLDINPIDLARGKVGTGFGGLFDYINDRPYAASSFLSTALARVYGSAMSGSCKEKPELAEKALPLEVHLTNLPCRSETDKLKEIFEPLGYEVSYVEHGLDETFPNWGMSDYVDLTLKGTVRLADLLNHLYVLIPVFDRQKHYWMGDDEVDKLLHHGGDWLKTHPEMRWITRRYFNRKKSYVGSALRQLLTEEEAETGISEETEESAAIADTGDLETPPAAEPETETTLEPNPERKKRRSPLNDQRLDAVVQAVRDCGAATVADLGCGEGQLLRRLLTERQITKLVGMDVSTVALARAETKLKLDRKAELIRNKLTLFQGALTYRDQRLEGFDAACVVEVVEHMDPDRLPAFARTVFLHAAPKTVILTTPNRSYNKNYEALTDGKLRHPDHRFEWTKEEFTAWAEAVCRDYGYTVRLSWIGETDADGQQPTQMGVFTKCG